MIHKTYYINAPVDQVWQALVNKKLIDKWGGGPAKMSNQVGADFSLWDGEIWGKNLKVVDGKLLKQAWSSSDMDDGTVSTVEFHLAKEGEGTKLELKHHDVPAKNHKSIDDGWDEYYLGPLKRLVEK